MASDVENNLEALVAVEKERLCALRSAPLDLLDRLHGVLLSDEIAFLCEDYDLITPFEQDCLRPAGYDLRVGERFAIGGEQKTLGSDGVLQIPPYQVAVVQTFETLNLPDFLIGRWNIRVKLAYKGLLWVGGAQVDPGFRGRLACPIYNLSKEPVELCFGDILAMIDFVPTTPFKEGISRPFQWWNRKVLFQEYNTNLESGVAEQLTTIEKKLSSETERITKETQGSVTKVAHSFKQSITEIQTRIDTFLMLIFTVVAVLFAGLGIVATKGTAESSFVTSSVWIAAVALYFALRPYMLIWTMEQQSRRSGQSPPDRERWWYSTLVPNVVELSVALLVVLSAIAFHLSHASITASQVGQASLQASQAIRDVKAQKEYTDHKVEDLQRQLDAVRADVAAKVAAMPTPNSAPASPSESRTSTNRHPK